MSKLQMRVLYGLRSDVSGNAHFITDDEVLYVVGNGLALHNFTQNRQRLVRLPDRNRVNLLAISPNKKLAALCESGEHPVISIYDLSTLKRKKILGIPNDPSGSIRGFACVSFSYDSKYLAAVTSENQSMLFYNWEKGKIESSIELSNSQLPSSRVSSINCNPADTAIIALGGPFCFKFLTLSETLWRPYGFSKADNLHVTSLTWLNSDRLLAGTLDGRILYLENGELRNVFKVHETVYMNMKVRDENAAQVSSSGGPADHSQAVLCLLTFVRGFAFAHGYGNVVVFEKDGPHKYTKRNLYSVPQQVSKLASDELYKVNSLSTNPSCDKILVTTGWAQLFYAKLWGPDILSEPEPKPMATMGHQLHHGPIGGLSTCTWKSHIVTFGTEDRSVRMWDYETGGLVMAKQYQEDISCVVLHPSGLFCLIGFSDKLRFMSVLLDDFQAIRHFPIRACRIAAFSTAGHLFSAVNGNIIHIYSTIDFNLRFLLKGHTELIKNVVWGPEDTKMYSIGSEGAIYEWNTITGQRASEVVLKNVTLNGIVLSADGVTAFCISGDGRIHEIRDSMVVRVYHFRNIEPSHIAMSKDDALVYVTYPGGFVASLDYPLVDPIELTEYRLHDADVSQMALSYDEHALITTGLDGTISFWRVTYAYGTATTSIRDMLYLEQILISREDLSVKVQTIKDLYSRVKEQETEHAYKLRQMMLQHNDTVREIHSGYCEAIEELRDKIDKLEEDHANEINSINVEIASTRKAHEEEIRNMEISYDAKLIVEYDKYGAFEKKNNEMRRDFEGRLKQQAEEYQAKLEETIANFEARLDEKDRQLRESHEENAQSTHVHEIIKTQIEDDADREIIELRASYEAQLQQQREQELKLKGEAGVLRRKYEDAQKDLADCKWHWQNLRNDYAELKARKEELDKEVSELEAEAVQREATIVARGERIRDLEMANDELDKIRFVLNHRIGELKAQIEPRDALIAELKGKVADMELELLGMNRASQRQELKVYEMREKLSSAKREIQHEKHRRKMCQERLKRMRVDLLDAAALINEPTALKNTIIKLYQRYSDQAQFLREHQADVDVQSEFAKQRDHLENTIALLKKQLNLCSSTVDPQATRVFEDNMELLSEMSGLRDELKSAQRHIADMECLLGLKGRDTSPLEARAKLAKAVHGNEDLERTYNEQMQECKRVVEGLRVNLERLMLEKDTDDVHE
ncbi:hypothetical protein TKK_0018316 [Trichogramma kaykai]|uniref:WD repeat-containing protein 55 homolog n=1 Tax=Trichogramma kaykai TaxID=54128 RepID=A0ABD2VZ60_9HYME